MTNEAVELTKCKLLEENRKHIIHFHKKKIRLVNSDVIL